MDNRGDDRWCASDRLGSLRRQIVGIDQAVPVVGGWTVRHVNLDHAATTPALRSVVDAVERFLPFSGSVHRGAGYRSRVSTAAFERDRDIVGRFVGADSERDVVVFTKNTTEAINRLAATMPLGAGEVVLTTALEHHSNDLPWRARAEVVHIRATADGALDEDDLDTQLERHRGRVALLAVSGASNVTGVVQPVHRLAERVHRAGARIFVDAAQLAAHRPIDMRPHDDPGHLDAVAFSGHKMYAPFGSGALIADRTCFGDRPDHPGGGTVRAVTLDEVMWADLPDRGEAGSPNVVGAVALAAAIETLGAVGLDVIAEHEAALTRYATDRLARVPGLNLYGPATHDRVGVIPFAMAGIPHGLVAAILGDEHGIGVRNGCFCAHPYIAHLLGLDRAEAATWLGRVGAGDQRGAPGLVRLSLGCSSDREDVDRIVDATLAIAAGEIRDTYDEQPDGSFVPSGGHPPLPFGLTG